MLLAWLALTLSCLFFYPLFAALHDQVTWLQWRSQNSMELIAAVLLSTLLLTCLLWLIHKVSNDQIRFVPFFVIFITSFSSFFIYFLRQLGFKDTLITLGQYANILMVALSCLFLLLVIRYPRKMYYALIMILLTLSPLNLLAGWTLWNVRNVNTKTVINAPVHYEKKAKTPNHNLIVILFDELSYEYLYKDCSIKPQYVNFHRLSSLSDNYHEAKVQGKWTLESIPSILIGRSYDEMMKYDSRYKIMKGNNEEYLKIEPNNLFALAKVKGYKNFAYGSVLSYCEVFGQHLDGCRSFSIYNYAGVETQFSLLNPIMTTVILWTRHGPQGFIKKMAITQLQRKETDQLSNLILKTLDEKEPFFMFSHIMLPHSPFIFNRNGYYENKERFLQNSENYQKNLEYVDHLLGIYIDKMKEKGIFDSSKIIVLSDHNYRIMFPGRENHIPLIIKRPYQQTKKDIYESAHTEYLLRRGLM